MKHIKSFESILDIFKSKSNNVRISLGESDFKQLCERGYITNNNTKIEIDMDNFVELIGGSIVSIEKNGIKYKIALQDIGLSLILHYSRKSPYYN